MDDKKDTIRILENGRAKFAYECAVNGSNLDKKKEYKSYVKKIPMLIKTNGLGATFAFMMSKGDTYTIIGEQILEWLKNNDKLLVSDIKGLTDFSEFNKKVISLNSLEYRALTNEILAFLNWLRRFAEGLIEGEE